MVVEGSVIGDKYRVDRVLAQGGMGTVLAATHLQLEQQVALKVLLPELLEDPLAVERFLREGKAAAQLHGEHVCRVLDVSVLDDGVPYLVMELLSGCDLQQLLGQHGALPEPTAVTYVLQACVGLAEAHARGIVHRDLKPANLFVTQGPDEAPLVKVLDFGIAKVTLGIKDNLTSTTSVIGSPHYMAPEQLRASREADMRSDLWSLGAILYELVSGEKAFAANSIMELSLRIAMDPPPPLPDASPALAAVIATCLEKEPDARFADIADFADALAATASGDAGEEARALAAAVARVYFAGRPEERTARRPKLANPGMAASSPTPASAMEAEAAPLPGRSRRRHVGAALAGAVLLAGLAAALLVPRLERSQQPRAVLPADEDEPAHRPPTPALPDQLDETKPAGETKPDDAKPDDETKPAGETPVPSASSASSASFAAGEPAPETDPSTSRQESRRSRKHRDRSSSAPAEPSASGGAAQATTAAPPGAAAVDSAPALLEPPPAPAQPREDDKSADVKFVDPFER